MGILQVLLPNAALVAFYQIYRKQGNLQFKRVWHYLYFMAQVIFWPISFGTFALASYYSVGEIWKTHNRAIQLAHGLQFLYVTFIYQYSLVTLERVNPFRRTIVFSWILFNINNYTMIYHGYAYFDEVTLFYTYNVI